MSTLQKEDTPKSQNLDGTIDLTKNSKGIIAAIVFICYMIMSCFIFGFRYSFHVSNEDPMVWGDIVLVAGLSLLAIVGFGLINSYISPAGFSGFGLNFLIYALTIQHFFFMRAFWDKAGANDPSAKTYWSETDYANITFANVNTDRFDSEDLNAASFVEAIGCSIAMIVAFSSSIGRIQFLQVFLLTLFGTFFYELNSQIIWRLEITDIGFGMRIFIFGGIVGIASSILLGRKQTTVEHPYYYSSYPRRGLSLLGLIISFCLFPLLCVGGLYRTSANNSYIQQIAALNMYLALGSGIIASFIISCLTYRKASVFNLIFSGLNGGIAYSSCADIHRNPGVPLTIGLIVGLLTSLYHSRLQRKLNKNGIIFSLGTFNRFLVPGLFAGIMGAILHAVGEGTIQNSYTRHIGSQRSSVGQGAMQLIGILLSIAFGGICGVLVGILWKIVNKNATVQQFNDNTLYAYERKDDLKKTL